MYIVYKPGKSKANKMELKTVVLPWTVILSWIHKIVRVICFPSFPVEFWLEFRFALNQEISGCKFLPWPRNAGRLTSCHVCVTMSHHLPLRIIRCSVLQDLRMRVGELFFSFLIRFSLFSLLGWLTCLLWF